jgi:hypothetical protein
MYLGSLGPRPLVWEE